VTVGVFRGYKAIQEVLTRVEPLAQFALTVRPDIKFVRISRSDYDLICRYKQAGIAQRIPISYQGGVPHYRGLELGHDGTLGRYVKAAPNTQTDLVEACAVNP
jgi:hypothetical protein